MKKLNDLTKIILETIYVDVVNKELDGETTITGETEITLKDEVIGYVIYSVGINELSASFGGSWEFAPYAGDYDITLESAIVSDMYSSNNIALINIQKALNGLLEKSIGKTL